MKEQLNKCPRGTLEQLGHYVIRPALDLIREGESEWVSHWVADLIVDGSLHGDYWVALVSSVPADLKERLLQSIETEDLQHTRHSGLISVLRATSDVAMAERVFERLCTLWKIIARAPDERHDLEWALERQLEDLFRTLPPNIAVEGLAGRISGEVKPFELAAVARVFSRVGRNESELRNTLRGELRQILSAYFTKGVSVALRADDFNGEQKANLASALAQVGEPEDLPLLRELIQADISRRQRGMEAKMRGERNKLADGAVMSYANWHVRALLQLAPNVGDTVLLDLLKEPEYERDAAWGLVQMASTSNIEAAFGFGLGFVKSIDYAKIWEARQGRLPWDFHEERRSRYATAVRERIESLLQESKDTKQPRAYDFRLKELTKVLAVIDGAASTGLILELLSVQDTWNGWPVVQALDTLQFSGVVLPTDETLKTFDTLLEHVRQHLWNDQQRGLLIHALCLLPFIENPATGIAKIREVVAELKLRTYQLRDVTAALGQSRCPQAVVLLGEFASDHVLITNLGDAWINAVAALDYPESRRLLLSSVDPDVSGGLPAGLTFYREDVLAARLAEIAQRDQTVRERLFELSALQLPPANRKLLGEILAMLGTTEAILAALNLMDDSVPHSFPYEVWKKIEDTFVEHKAVDGNPRAYIPAPRSANSIRSRLFEMATTDERRKKASSSLLAQIEVWRLEYGRPYGEPRNPDPECTSAWPTLLPSNAKEQGTAAD